MSKTIIVSNRLPIRIEKNGDKHTYLPSEGGLATGLGSVYKENGNIWVGWPGIEALEEDFKKEIHNNLEKNHMRPVFLTAQELEDYYLGFSNQTLWPAFHYFVQYIQFDESRWQAYKAVNEKFAEAILNYAEDDDIIWVHDYQLMLVPQLLRQKLPEACIGFFQHIPFPSYEVFRMLPWRRELLNGLLGSDFLGFHTYDDVRHFLSSVHRLTHHSYEANALNVNGRKVEADALPMGIDFAKYYRSARSQEVQEQTQKFREAFGSQRMILSVDRLDYSKGIPDRLKAFERFLHEFPDYQGKISIILVVVPSRDKVPSYQLLKDEVDKLVGQINGSFSVPNWQPVHYFYRSFPLPQLSAFYRLCDIAMITPLRDGMNLVCKEFIASKYDLKGVLILSEMAGSAKELSESILVNPRDEMAMVKALKQAMEMEDEEQERRLKLMQKSLQKYDIFSWVKLFTENLQRVKQEQQKLLNRRLGQDTAQEILQQVSQSNKTLLLLDYDGTLVPFFDNPEDSVPDEELMRSLQNLAENPQVELVFISGRPAKFLEEHLGALKVTLVAEHGIWLKEKNSQWESIVELPDEVWKQEARKILDFYIDRTPGSFLEEKENALVWHFRKVEKDLAALRSSEMASHLKHVLTGKGVEILQGNKVVEIKPAAMNKGKIALRLQQKFQPVYTIAVGDDQTDEYIFKALQQKATTIKVGSGQTFAQYSVASHVEVRELLLQLQQATGK